jgi:hypothetical protein
MTLLIAVSARADNDSSFLTVTEISCIQVLNDDSVQLNLNSSFSSSFYSSANLLGPYSPSIGYTVSGANTVVQGDQNTASDITWFYFYDASDNSYSDTLSNIVLDLDPMNGGGIANLSWNHPFTASYQLPSQSYYSVKREYPVGVWQEIAQVSTSINSYLDTITICDAFLRFRVDLITGTNCDFISNIVGDFFVNNTPPDIPEIIQVSVDTALGFVNVTWNPPPQNDVQGYVIVQNINGFSVAIDTIWDPTITSYTDLNTEVDLASYSYGIAAFDTCINPNSNPPFYYISPPTALFDFQHSILLENQYFGCDQYNELWWNTYVNWPDGVFKYQLYVSQDGAAYQLLEEFGPQDSSYVHTDLDPFSTYCYMVKAINNDQDRFSLSNILCQEVLYPGLPDLLYLASAQVDSSENVRLEFYVSSNEPIEIEGFTIQALYPSSFEFVNIADIPFDGSDLYSYVDENTEADISSIYYRIQLIDGCGNANSLSNEINTVYVAALSDEDNAVNTIVWNQAEGRAGQISAYQLYRYHYNEQAELIYSAGPQEFYYQDDLSEAWQEDGAYCYFIRPLEVSNPYGSFSQSQSNKSCTLISPRIWIPNSFVVNGDTPTFTPVFSYAAVQDYKMTILNRWSTTIFETQDPYVGWNGYYKGNPVVQDAYIYIIQLEDGFGKLITETGSVTVFINQ